MFNLAMFLKSIIAPKKSNDKRKNTNTSLSFESLTPSEDNELGVYESALDYVFENPDIKNVALSGAYGAGKSSVLASYKKKTQNKNRKYIHISLAHFEDGTDPAEESKTEESVLEGKILNQLMHQIPESNIPQTHFSIKSDVPKCVIARHSFLLSMIILLILHLTLSSKWESFVEGFHDGVFKCVLSMLATPEAYLFSGIVTFIIGVYLIYQIVKAQINHRIFKKLNLQGNEIEMFGDSNDSYFDKYLNEVLYLFENSQADVIVFEDMDRFNAYQIFERLREVNNLINLRSKGKVIRFFYLLKDDIFTSKDRTKFFDFIIPIVPVVDGSNSYDQFIAHFQKNDLFSKFDERFLKGLSLYVDEMRLLKNICNEFLVYYTRLNTTELDYNKMLALITYKNLFPRDFSELQLGRGFVHALFEHKDDFVEEEKKRIENSISKMEARVEQITSEVLISPDEIKIVYGKKKEPYYWNEPRWAKLDAEMQDRLQLIEDRNNGVLNQLQMQIKQKQKELAELRAKPLHNIINRDNAETIFRTVETNEIGHVNEFLDVKSNDYFPMLKFLIRNGYIDESYSDYMTYFYGNSLSRTDKVFLRSVTDCKAKPYMYELKAPQKVLEQLDEIDFDQEETLNYCLTDYLLQTNPHSKHVQHLICQLQEKKKYDFIAGYLDVSKLPVEFVHQCNVHWESPFRFLLSDNAQTEKVLNQYAVLTLYSNDKKAITRCNDENSLTEYITASSSILDIENPQIECLIEGFQLLNVVFERLQFDKSNHELLDAVYKNDMYVISLPNIKAILTNIYEIKDEESILHRNYSFLYDLRDTPIKNYIEANIALYVNCMLEFCDGIIVDENDAAAALLNNSEVSEDQKKQYIKFLKNPLANIDLVDDPKLWSELIEAEAITFSEKNVLDYYNHSKKADHYFAQLINAAARPINFEELAAVREEEEIDQLFDAIVPCDELEDDKYEQCVVSLPYHYEEFSVSGLSVQKMMILIRNRIIIMNAETLQFVRSHYNAVVPEFILEQVDEYAALMDESIFDYSEMVQVLSMEVSDEVKLHLLEYTEEPVSIVDKGYSPEINRYILTNNLDEDDIPALFSRYDTYSTEIQGIILSCACTEPEKLEECADTCSLTLINRFFAESRMAQETKIKILSAILPRLNREQTIEYLNALDLSEYVKVFDSHARPKFKITSENERLLDAFRDKGWIYEYLEDGDRAGYYKIRRRNPNKPSDKRNPS